MGNLACMLEASRIDVGGLLVWLVKMLADNPDWLDRVRDEQGEAAAAPSALGFVLN